MSEMGIQKAAVLMLALGQEHAAQVMKFLDAKEMQKVGLAMASTTQVSEEALNAVLDDLIEEVQSSTALGVDNEAYIRSVLTNAVGEEDAGYLLSRILDRQGLTGIDSLKAMEHRQVADLISNEHPQIIATILAHLPRTQASSVMDFIPKDVRNDVMLRIATLGSVSSSALTELNDVLTKLLNVSDPSAKKGLGGVRVAAEMMNFLSSELEGSVMLGMQEYDQDLAQAVKDNMFVFNDIATLEKKDIQAILAEVSSDILVIALKGASETLKEKLFENMSTRAVESLKEDLETRGPTRLVEVEQHQREILQVVNRMIEEGKIELNSTDEEYL
jgi:flagellar motor switch protein FliG